MHSLNALSKNYRKMVARLIALHKLANRCADQDPNGGYPRLAENSNSVWCSTRPMV